MTKRTRRWRSPVTIAGAAVVLTGMLSGCTAPASEPATPTPTVTVDYQQQANDSWWDLWMLDYPDAVKPDVEVVREIAPSERGQVMSDCMTVAGYETTLYPDGSVAYEHGPESQREAHGVAVYVCHAQYPLADKYLQPETPESLGRLYDYWAGEATDCLAAHGFISSDEVPSRESYVQGRGSSWTPFNGLADAVEEDEFYTISAECVRYPDDVY